MTGSRKSPKRLMRIGIDVGGTFTHAVAIDASTLDIVARSKVKTTHAASEGVARGIIESLHKVLEAGDIDPAEVTFIAHSTTQATNALLEGDVATVGVIGMGQGAASWLAAISTAIPPVELSKGKFLTTHHSFIDTTNGINEANIKNVVTQLKEKGASAFAVCEAFGVDAPEHEDTVLSIIRAMGFPATSGSEVSKLYGLKTRTRTAVINAAMLPKMIETADMTESSVRAAGIQAPVMIMRSDGGVMDIDAMRKRPILTRLSGPAAGVAAAMMYLRISDGIFLEVGGTSTDISVIRNGKALVKDTEIGGNRVFLRSLDVITLGVAGGSMVRLKDNTVKDLGPRSAHIAGLEYVSFTDPVPSPSITLVSPKPGDPADYVTVTGAGVPAPRALTSTCAANYLGLVPAGDCASGNKESIKTAFDELGKNLSVPPEKAAEMVLDHAYDKCLPVVKKFASEYKLDLESTTLVGGGGGAAAIVPFVAKKMGCDHALANNADVISAIGVALALVRETVERQISQPTQDDLMRIRQEALDSVTAMGADPASVEVQVEVDPRASIVRATACGATAMQTDSDTGTFTQEERLQVLASSFKADRSEINLLASTDQFQVWGRDMVEKHLFGLLRRNICSIRVMDQKGVIRLKARSALVAATTNSDTEKVIASMAEENAVYGDAGKIIPDFMVIVGHRIVDLSGLLDTWQVQTLARAELSNCASDTKIVVVGIPS